MKQVLIVIPARYNSSRLPGKPLAQIAGIEMLKRVAHIAKHISHKNPLCQYIIATDDKRIVAFCEENNLPVKLTATSCQSGTERCWDLVGQLKEKPSLIINLQGDNPLCPPWFLEQLINAWQTESGEGQVFTPFVHLTWDEYQNLLQTKKITPYSGTTVQVDKQGYAITFSKLCLPAIREESYLKTQIAKSPIRRHIGLYAYTYKALEQYFQLEPGQYEAPEGLEQMRFIEHRIPIKTIEVSYKGRTGMSGIDSPEDIKRAEAIINESGEFDFDN